MTTAVDRARSALDEIIRRWDEGQRKDAYKDDDVYSWLEALAPTEKEME